MILDTFQESYKIRTRNADANFEPWLEKARERIFSIAAGNRIAHFATRIMEVGLGKILFAANELGVDVEQSNPFILFAPDGTCSYNPIRTHRGFSYGCIIDLDLDGLLGTNNSMPNGCGFSVFELNDPPSDATLMNYLADSQTRLGQDKLSQLGTGNHFAGIYYVLDPLSGEDTNRRMVVIHCSGHVGGNLLYHPHAWLAEEEGYNEIKTPHGDITLMESEAKRQYLSQYEETDRMNSENRVKTMEEIFPFHDWSTLEEITHQGLLDNGKKHVIGSQIHEGLMPIAFNPEEGLVLVKSKPNLSNEFISSWEDQPRIEKLGLTEKMQQLNITPHGAGYEFRYPLQSAEIFLGAEGIEKFSISLPNKTKMEFNYFREIREWMTYRRKAPILEQFYRADLGTIVFEMPSLMQIYPLVSIPGGSH